MKLKLSPRTETSRRTVMMLSIYLGKLSFMSTHGEPVQEAARILSEVATKYVTPARLTEARHELEELEVGSWGAGKAFLLLASAVVAWLRDEEARVVQVFLDRILEIPAKATHQVSTRFQGEAARPTTRKSHDLRQVGRQETSAGAAWLYRLHTCLLDGLFPLDPNDRQEFPDDLVEFLANEFQPKVTSVPLSSREQREKPSETEPGIESRRPEAKIALPPKPNTMVLIAPRDADHPRRLTIDEYIEQLRQEHPTRSFLIGALVSFRREHSHLPFEAEGSTIHFPRVADMSSLEEAIKKSFSMVPTRIEHDPKHGGLRLILRELAESEAS